MGLQDSLLVSLSRQPVPSPAVTHEWAPELVRELTSPGWPDGLQGWHRELVNCMIAPWETPVRSVQTWLTEVGGADGRCREREPVKHSHATTKFKGSGEPVNYWTVFFNTSNWPLRMDLFGSCQLINLPPSCRKVTTPKVTTFSSTPKWNSVCLCSVVQSASWLPHMWETRCMQNNSNVQIHFCLLWVFHDMKWCVP